MFGGRIEIRALVCLLAVMTVFAAMILLPAVVSGTETAPVEEIQTTRDGAAGEAGNELKELLQRIFDWLGTILVLLSAVLTAAAFLDKRGYR